MAVLTNKAIWDIAVEGSENFSTLASKYSYDEFKNAILTGRTAQEIKDGANDLIGTAITWYLREVVSVKAKDYLADKGIGLKINMPFGGYCQMLYAHPRKPVDPKWVGLKDGDSIDQQVITIEKVDEKFYGKNVDYSNTVTIFDIQLRDAFRTENGLGMLIGAKMANLEAEYIEFMLALKEEAINVAINSTDKPLNANQLVEVQLSDVPTIDEHKKFISTVNNIIDGMTIKATKAYNRAGWRTVQDPNKLCLLTRPTFANDLSAFTLSTLYNPENLAINTEVIKVQNFGGLVATEAGGTPLKMVYDNLGRIEGYAKQSAPEVIINESDIIWEDPNEDVIAVLCDKDFLVEIETEPYNVLAAPYNARGRYQVYWASKAGIGINIDIHKNFVVFKKAK